jgi:hypothetical protein
MKRFLYALTVIVLFNGSYFAQNGYTPNNKSQKFIEKNKGIDWEISGTLGLSKYSLKELDKIDLKLQKGILLDTNNCIPILWMANVQFAKKNYIGYKSAFFYYTLFSKKFELYPPNNFLYSRAECCLQSKIGFGHGYMPDREFFEHMAKYHRYLCLINAFKFDKKLFELKDNQRIKEISACFTTVEYDINNIFSSVSSDYNQSGPRRVAADQKVLIAFYLLKAEFEYMTLQGASSARSFLSLIDHVKNESRTTQADYTSNEVKSMVYTKMYELAKAKEDTVVQLAALTQFLNIPWDYTHIYKLDEDFNFQNMKSAYVELINSYYGIGSNDYQVVTKNGVNVFKDNTNIPLINYSSAIQFLRLYDYENNRMTIFKNIYPGDIKAVYKIYEEIGKKHGMIWPKYQPIDFDRDYLNNYELGKVARHLIDCGCIPNRILHIDYNWVYITSSKDERLTVVFQLDKNLRDAMRIPVSFLSSNSEISTSNELPSFVQCPKAKESLRNLDLNRNYDIVITEVLSSEDVAGESPVKPNPEVVNSTTVLNGAASSMGNATKTVSVSQRNSANTQQNESKPKTVQQDNASAMFYGILAYSLKLAEQDKIKKQQRAKQYRNCTWCGFRFIGNGYHNAREKSGCKVYDYGDFHSPKCAIEGCESGVSNPQ